MGRCGSSTRGTEGSCGHSREISQCGAPRGMQLDSLRKAIPFMPFDMFICIFPNIFPLPPHGGPVSGLWCCCGCPSQVSAVMSCRTRVAEHSLITPLFCGGMFPCVGQGKDSLSSIFALTRIVFIFFGVPESLCRKADLLQVLSHMRICPCQNPCLLPWQADLPLSHQRSPK